MRKVVVYEFVSLDGVAEDPDRFFGAWDDVVDAHVEAVIGSQDAVVLGRRTYDDWAAFWPGSDIEPFAGFINAVPKHVATSTPLDPVWTGASAIDGDLVAFVRDLRAAEGGDVGVHASIEVARTLLAADVVDEVRLVVAPAVAGTGRSLLAGLPPIRFTPLASTLTPSGWLLLDLRVDRPA